MITFTTFLEIFTTLAFCVTLSMLSAIAAQIIHTCWQKRKSRKRRIFYHQKRQEAELRKRERLLNKLTGDYKIVSAEKVYLVAENEALRKELRLYSEIRADMLSHSMRLENENFDLRSELNAAYREISACEND